MKMSILVTILMVVTVWDVEPVQSFDPYFYCNFDKGDVCDMTQRADDDIDWTVHKLATASDTTGPTSDIKGPKYYIYTEATDQFFNTTVVQTPLDLFDTVDSSDYELSFSYHMYGVDMGTLEVLALSGVNMTSATQLWKQTGAVGTSWLTTTVSIPANTKLIAFRGTTGSNWRSDMSVDEVKIKRSVGGSGPDVLFDCNFDDKTLCGMTQRADDDMDWSLQTGPTSSSDTGPDDDSTGTGYYVYTEASSHSNDVAILQTPAGVFNGSTEPNVLRYNMQFSYHMYGSEMGKLEVLSLTGVNLATASTIWQKDGEAGNVWNTETVRIPLDTKFIAFRGTVGSGFMSDMAIDEITIGLTKIRDIGSCWDMASVVAECDVTGRDRHCTPAVGPGSFYIYYEICGVKCSLSCQDELNKTSECRGIETNPNCTSADVSTCSKICGEGIFWTTYQCTGTITHRCPEFCCCESCSGAKRPFPHFRSCLERQSPLNAKACP